MLLPVRQRLFFLRRITVYIRAAAVVLPIRRGCGFGRSLDLVLRMAWRRMQLVAKTRDFQISHDGGSD